MLFRSDGQQNQAHPASPLERNRTGWKRAKWAVASVFSEVEVVVPDHARAVEAAGGSKKQDRPPRSRVVEIRRGQGGSGTKAHRDVGERSEDVREPEKPGEWKHVHAGNVWLMLIDPCYDANVQGGRFESKAFDPKGLLFDSFEREK